jgi:hypothetical protein
LPDVSTLLSLALTSKEVYEVFRAFRRSVVLVVANNQVGPSLPQALRLARCRAAGLVQRDVGNLPGENDPLPQEISPEELQILAQNAQTVAELEDLFSWRYGIMSGG